MGVFGLNLKGDTNSPFSIQVDMRDFEKKMNLIKKDFPKIGKRMMVKVFQAMRNDIKNNIRVNFKRHKGWLLSDINYWAFFDNLSGSIFTRNSKRQGVHYASVLEEGATIFAKNGRFLVFYRGKNSKGQSVLSKVNSVVIPPRPFFKPVVDDFWSNGGFKAKRIMDLELQKTINMIEKGQHVKMPK